MFYPTEPWYCSFINNSLHNVWLLEMIKGLWASVDGELMGLVQVLVRLSFSDISCLYRRFMCLFKESQWCSLTVLHAAQEHLWLQNSGRLWLMYFHAQPVHKTPDIQFRQSNSLLHFMQLQHCKLLCSSVLKKIFCLPSWAWQRQSATENVSFLKHSSNSS